MFTGIVQAVGRIAHVAKAADGVRLAVDLGVQEIADVVVGDSVCVNGCCLTVTAMHGASLEFDVSAETLRCTTGLDRLGDVNIELALRLADRLGGHLTSGHVDGVSLTVNEVSGARFAVNLIPHTLAVTTLKRLAPGARVNLEIDIVARYVARLAQFPA